MNEQKILTAFYTIAQAQQWHALHTPKNLASALVVEAGELLAEFAWLDPAANLDTEALERISGELADVAMYLTVLADKLNIDLDQALAAKMAANRARFLDSPHDSQDRQEALDKQNDK